MGLELRDVWDMHVDLRNVDPSAPQRGPFFPYEEATPHKPFPRLDRSYLLEQIDLPTARQIGGIFTATGRKAGAPKGEQLELLRREIARIKGMEGMTLVRSAADVDGTGRQVMHAEGIYFIQEEKDLKLLDWLWEEGYRSLGLTYNEDGPFCGGATGDPNRGLKPLGRDFALEAWRKGFMLCCAHSNHKTQDELAELALKTGNALHYTHGLLDEPYRTEYVQRGLPRQTARKLMATGGLVGLSPHPGFVAKIDRYFEEIAFLAEISPTQVVLGSDFAGTNSTGPDGNYQFDEIKGVWGVPGFARLLEERHGEELARGFCGGSLKAYVKKKLP